MVESIQELRLVEFGLGGETFATDVTEVTDILFVPQMTPVPGTPGEVMGLFNLRGVVTALLDCSGLFNLRRQPRSRTTRILVLEPVSGAGFALWADYVADIATVDAAMLAPPPEGTPGVEMLRGVYNRGTGPTVVLDAAALVEAPLFQQYR